MQLGNRGRSVLIAVTTNSDYGLIPKIHRIAMDARGAPNAKWEEVRSEREAYARDSTMDVRYIYDMYCTRSPLSAE